MGIGYYILNEQGQPVECDDVSEWARWFETHRSERIVAHDVVVRVAQTVTVSTVFVGIDYNFGDGPALLWETMAFGASPPWDQWQERYSSRESALAGHKRVVAAILAGEAP